MLSVYEKLGGVVKTARIEKHMTRKELAIRLSISVQYLMTIENKQQIPGSELLYRIIRVLDISADLIFYPEHGQDCELVNRLHILIGRLEETNVELAISILQVLLQAKCAEGGDPQCRIKCPHI